MTTVAAKPVRSELVMGKPGIFSAASDIVIVIMIWFEPSRVDPPRLAELIDARRGTIVYLFHQKKKNTRRAFRRHLDANKMLVKNQPARYIYNFTTYALVIASPDPAGSWARQSG